MGTRGISLHMLALLAGVGAFISQAHAQEEPPNQEVQAQNTQRGQNAPSQPAFRPAQQQQRPGLMRVQAQEAMDPRNLPQ